MITLIKVSSAPGSTHERVFKVFDDREKAKDWLEENGYVRNGNIKNCWEHAKDEDDFVWTYLKIKTISN